MIATHSPRWMPLFLLLSAGALSAQSPAPTAALRCAYLGVATRPLNPTLRTQLGLPEGIGLVVLYAAPDSPASKGLKSHDVLHKFEDQLLVSQHQLATLIKLHQNKDTVELSVIRRGTPMTIDVTLAETEQQPARTIAPAVFNESVLSTFDLSHTSTNKQDPQESSRSHSSTRTLVTEDHYVTLSIRDGKKSLNARDRSGKVLFKGAINSKDERDAIPDKLLPILKKLETQRSSPLKMWHGSIP